MNKYVRSVEIRVQGVGVDFFDRNVFGQGGYDSADGGGLFFLWSYIQFCFFKKYRISFFFF